MKFRSLTALFLCFVLLFPLAGCKNDDPIVSDTSGGEISGSETTAPPVPAADPVKLVENGVANIKIIRGDGAEESEITAAREIYKYFLTTYPSGNIEFCDDFGIKDQDLAIVVGRTSCPETKQVLGELNYGEFAIRPVGKKVVITGWQASSMILACDEFLSMVKAKDQNDLTVTSDDSIKKAFNKNLENVPSYPAKNPTRIVNAGDSAYQIYFANSNADDRSAYVKILADNGFETVYERTVGDNVFGTYKKDKTAITVNFTLAGRALRIIAEPASNVPFTETEAKPAVTTPKLTMIGRRFSTNSVYLDHDAGAGLTCFLLRLSDGRFIVFDGGVYGDLYASALYVSMKDQAPDPDNIVIAAWIFSHTHNDHIGGFCNFAERFSTMITIQGIYCNFPLESDSKINGGSDESADYARFRTALSYYKNTPRYKPHTGQLIHIGDAEIEWYYTQEDIVNSSRTMATQTVAKNWNNSSSIMSITIAGQKIMFLGDAQEAPNNQTAAIFGSHLKSDIVQIAHHGGVGGTKAIYKEVDPEIALFTTTDDLVPVYISTFDYNYYLINELHVKEYYNAADRITSWDLPYHATSNGFIK